MIILCKPNMFSMFQAAHILKGNDASIVHLTGSLDTLAEELSALAAQSNENAMIFLNGATDYCTALKNQILEESKLKYNKKNVEVEII